MLCPHQDKHSLLKFGKVNAIDFVALSFTRSADDVREARAYLDSIGMHNTKIIAKIENKVGGWVQGGVCAGWVQKSGAPGAQEVQGASINWTQLLLPSH